MKKALFLIVLVVGSYVGTQAQAGIFLDQPFVVPFSFTSNQPNTTFNFPVRQKAGYGTGDISFATTANGTYSDPLTYSVTTDGTGAGSFNVYIKGTTLGLARVELNFVGAWQDFATVHVTTVNSVTMTHINSPALDTNPNASGGKRIYPDGNAPGDTTTRKTVKVTATLADAKGGVPITFKSFDVDDPSASNDSVDPDGGSGAGLDNRGSAQNGIMQATGTTGTTNQVVVVTNSSGVAEAELVVSLHPGDNYRVAVSGNTAALNDIRVDGINLEDSSDNTLPLTKVKGTDMLTVWRRLHLEVDKMGTVAGNTGSDIIDTVWQLGGESMLFTFYNPYQTRRFENGRLDILGDFYNVVYNDSSYFHVMGDVDYDAEMQTFYVTDDDDFNDDDTPNNGDYGDSVSHLNALYNLTTVNTFAPAYITVLNDGGGDVGNNNTTAFHLNPFEADLDDIFTASYDSWSDGADNFWIAYLVSGYQPEADSDNDPGSEDEEELGITKGFADDDIGVGCIDVPLGGSYSFIWQETIRDFFVQEGDPVDDLTAPHEIGHQLGLNDRAGNYLMSETEFGYATLHPNDIHILRCRTKAPGRS